MYLFICRKEWQLHQEGQEMCFSWLGAGRLHCCLSKWGAVRSGAVAGHAGAGGGRLGRFLSSDGVSSESETAQNTKPHWILCGLGLNTWEISSPPQTGIIE